jgi:hypothetical protein
MASEADPQLPFDWEGTPAPDPAAAPPELTEGPPRRVAPRLAALAFAAAVAGGALAVALSSGGGAGQGGPVALAASVTNNEPGFKFDLTVSATDSGQTTSVEASGAFNTGPPLSGSMDATVGGTAISELIVGGDLYVQSALSGGKWLEAPLPSTLGAAGSSGGSTELTSADPSQTLQYLRASGTVTNLGQATIGGVATTHYHDAIDLSHYASTLPASQQAAAQQDVAAYEQATGTTTLPIDVWIDGSNLVRQIQFDISTTSGASAAFTMNVYDYGPQSAVSAPPAGEVISAVQTPSTPAQTPSTPVQTPSTPAQTPSSPPAGTPSHGSGNSQPAD